MTPILEFVSSVALAGDLNKNTNNTNKKGKTR